MKNITYMKLIYEVKCVVSVVGLYGVPKDLCGEMYALAVDEFQREKPLPLFLEEIHFVNLENSMLENMKAGFENLKSGVTKIPLEQRYPNILWLDVSSTRSYAAAVGSQSSSEHQNHKSASFHGSKVSKLNISSSRSSVFQVKRCVDEKMAGIVVKVFEFCDKLKIKIYTGSIVKFHGDAIIISSDQYVTGQGALGNAVQLAGGRRYEKEFENMKKELTGIYPKIGDTFRCKGGDINATYVLHVVLNQLYDTRQPKLAEHKTALLKALEKVGELHWRKVAMPLIGAGNK